MPKIVRRWTVEIADDEGEPRTIRMKTWSTAKLFFVVREFWGVFEAVMGDIRSAGTASEIEVVRSVIEKLLSSEAKAAELIRITIDDPSGMTVDEILEWQAVDFVKVLTECIEKNITEEFQKNSRALLGLFRSAKKSTETESQGQD